MSVNFIQGSNCIGYLKGDTVFQKKMPLHISKWKVGEKSYVVYIINTPKEVKTQTSSAAESAKVLRKTASAAKMSAPAKEDKFISRIRLCDESEMQSEKKELKDENKKSFDPPIYIDRLNDNLFEKTDYIDLDPNKWDESVTKVHLYLVTILKKLSLPGAAAAAAGADDAADSDDSVKTSFTRIANKAAKPAASADSGAGAAAAADAPVSKGAATAAAVAEVTTSGGAAAAVEASAIKGEADAPVGRTELAKTAKPTLKRSFVCSRTTMVALITVAAAALIAIVQARYRFGLTQADGSNS
jgi:hypothetical protein